MSRTPFAVIIFFFLCLFLYTKLAGAIPFSVTSVQTTKSNFFQASGTGEATAVPDTALLSFGVTKTAPTVEAAQKEANTVVNTITDELKKLGVEEKNIKTTNYNVNPDYDFNTRGSQQIKGYTVTQNIEVRLKPVDQANKAVDIATESGANLVGGVQFVLDEETQKEVEAKAQKEAIEKAKDKAQSLASATGLSLGKIVDVQVGSSQQPRFEAMAVDAKNAMGGETQLNPGENKVQVTVTLSYELR
jgi:uncharacterized protein YggE